MEGDLKNSSSTILQGNSIMIKEEVIQSAAYKAKKSKYGMFLRSFRRNFIYGLLLAIVIALILMTLMCPRCWSDFSYAGRHIFISILYGLGLHMSLGYLNSYLATKVQWLKKPWQSFFITLTLSTITVILVVALINVIWRGLLLDVSPMDTIRSLEPIEYLIPLIIGLFISSVFIGASFLSIWKKSLLEAEQFKQAQLSAKFEALNSQVNPHFLFNSLNVLSSLVKKDPAKAEDFIHQLSNVYRNVLEFRKEELISTKKELNTLNAYLFLLQTRFGERIRLTNKLVASETSYIVPLSLQMLLENAIKHNAATTKNPLLIEIYEQDSKIWVKNNRQLLNEAVEGKKMGLDNIAQRYKLATDEEIIVEETDTYFKVGLPVIQD